MKSRKAFFHSVDVLPGPFLRGKGGKEGRQKRKRKNRSVLPRKGHFRKQKLASKRRNRRKESEVANQNAQALSCREIPL